MILIFNIRAYDMTVDSYRTDDPGMPRIGAAELLILLAIFSIFVLPLIALVVVVLVRGKKKTQD